VTVPDEHLAALDEAERRGWQENHQRRLNEEREVQRRVLALRQELEEIKKLLQHSK